MQSTEDIARRRNELLAAKIKLDHLEKIGLFTCSDDPHTYYTYAKEDHETAIILCTKLIESREIGLGFIPRPPTGLRYSKDALWRRIVEQAEQDAEPDEHEVDGAVAVV
jgi:hypothetical protein